MIKHVIYVFYVIHIIFVVDFDRFIYPIYFSGIKIKVNTVDQIKYNIIF